LPFGRNEVLILTAIGISTSIFKQMKFVENHWTTLRTPTFIVVGLSNAFLIREEEIGTWKNYLGTGFWFFH